jgi:hypothetical protein
MAAVDGLNGAKRRERAARIAGQKGGGGSKGRERRREIRHGEGGRVGGLVVMFGGEVGRLASRYLGAAPTTSGSLGGGRAVE